MSNWKEDKEWQRDYTWRGWRSLFFNFWFRKSRKEGEIYFTRTLKLSNPRVRSTYMEGFDDGRFKLKDNLFIK